VKQQSTQELSIDAQITVVSPCSGGPMHIFSLTYLVQVSLEMSKNSSIQPSSSEENIAFVRFTDYQAGSGNYIAGVDASDASTWLFSNGLGVNTSPL